MNLLPTDRAEQIARFRASVIGPLMCRDLGRRELAASLRALSHQRYRLPDADTTRTFAVSTLERWYYAYRKGGFEALRPRPRSDRGYAKELSARTRELLLDIRREHPSASVPLILRTLETEGRLDKGAVSAPTVRRLYAAHSLDRQSTRAQGAGKTRRRWAAERPGALWHGDVCHVPAGQLKGLSKAVRIHALLDDASRYVIALEAHDTEKEVDMLGMLVDALRRHGRPDGLYLDNGATYRGHVLQTACAHLGIGLLHAKPYDPQARGKMERFWRTLRQGCLDYLGEVASLDDVQARLWAFLDRHYHQAPHAGLMGKSPGSIYAIRPAPMRVDEAALREAMTERKRRQVSRDNVISIKGKLFELEPGYLAGKKVLVAQCFVLPEQPPWVEHEGKRFALHQLDPVKNARRKRTVLKAPSTSSSGPPVDFQPARALLAAGALRQEGGDE